MFNMFDFCKLNKKIDMENICGWIFKDNYFEHSFMFKIYFCDYPELLIKIYYVFGFI